MSNEAPPEPSPRGRRLSELLQELVKTQKRLRLYEGTVRDWRRLEESLFQAFDRFLEEDGEIALGIREAKILYRDETVYENADRKESLAFLFFRDGIRHLSLSPGLEAEELHSFLEALNEVRVVSNEEADLVTLFWERDFQSIRYLAIDELPGAASGPRLEEELAEPTASESPGGGSEGIEVRIADLDQPVSRLPSNAARLDEEEVAELRSELALEAGADFPILVAELALELALLDEAEEGEETEELQDGLRGVVTDLVAEGRIGELLRLVDHLEGLQALSRDVPQGNRLLQALSAALSEPSELASVLGRASADRTVEAPELATFLSRLGESTLPTLVPWMGRMERPELRRAVSEAVASTGRVAHEALAGAIPAPGETISRPLAREILHVVRRIPVADALELIDRLVEVEPPEIRRETAVTLGAMEGAEVEAACVGLLDHPDPEVRSVVLAALRRRGGPELAGTLRHWVEGHGELETLGYEEKRRVFRLIGRFGGEEAVRWLEERLQPSARRWLVPRSKRELDRALAEGLAVAPPEVSRIALERLASSDDRSIRGACREALARLEEGD